MESKVIHLPGCDLEEIDDELDMSQEENMDAYKERLGELADKLQQFADEFSVSSRSVAVDLFSTVVVQEVVNLLRQKEG